jgi:uncharacterized protein YukE
MSVATLANARSAEGLAELVATAVNARGACRGLAGRPSAYAGAVANWPNWKDVDFDFALAQAVIDECDRAAGALDTGLTGLSTAVAALDRDGAWIGSYSDDFHEAEPRLKGDATRTRDALRTLAGSIATASQAAHLEQQRREGERESWQQQEAAEDAAPPRPSARS